MSLQQAILQAHIMIIDDQRMSVLMLQSLLKQNGFNNVQAFTDPREGLAHYADAQVDLVLLDIDMPHMDGFQVMEALKGMERGSYIPVLVLTGLQDERTRNRALESGAKDFLTKPFNPVETVLRVRNMLEVRLLHSDIQRQNEILAKERAFVEEIINRMREVSDFETRNIRYLIEPVSTSCGDILLSARPPGGGQHVFLGDFTGHGLCASLGGPIVNDIFYLMTAKGFSMDEILGEMNRKLNAKLPVGMFLAGAFMAVAPDGTVTVWNGGLPELVLFDGDGTIDQRFGSDNLPLGIVGEKAFRVRASTVQPAAGSRLVAFSDGSVETCDVAGEMFGQERMENVLRDIYAGDGDLDRLLAALEDYSGSGRREDDLTLVELALPLTR
ncbi:MAG: SpoIIE family protein phosphatase [Magnetococcales bacterium]|nr:SpoIIE family protein phosphatase [Magnetococcales bacterium]